MEINLPFDSSKKTLDLIKLSALYYDKVNILCPSSLNDTDYFFDKKLLDNIDILEKNEVVKLSFCDIDQILNSPSMKRPNEWHSLIDFNDIFNKFKKQYNFLHQYNELEIINCNKEIKELREDIRLHEIALKQNENKEIINQIIEVIEQKTLIMEKNKILMQQNFTIIELKFKLHLYYQIYLFFMSISLNQSIISNELLQTATNQIYKKNNKDKKSELISEAISILLPNYYQMNFEDILDLRYFAKDELQEMRYYISLLSSEFSPDDMKLEDPRLFLESKINPAIKQLKNKVTGLRIGVIQRALQGLKNPLTYTPLLTTFFANIPAHISLAASMGLIGVEAGLEYLKQKKELETNPLYFSVKLRDINNKLL